MSFLARKIISAAAQEDPVDDDFKLTTLLIHGNGSNGGTNNQSGVSILDTSDEGHTVIDPNADVFPGTFSPFSAEEGKWSGRFHRSHPDYFAFDNSDFAFGTGDFTIECWVYYVEAHQYGSGIFQPKDGVFGPALGQHSDDGWQIYHGTSETSLADTDMPIHEWVHIAYVRASNVVNVYQNGVKVTSDISDSTNYTTTTFNIGKYYSDNFGMDGYISNFRVVKGTAVYTSNFTPPTEPLTAITNTVLLTCCSNRFRDKSTSGHSLLHSTTSAVNPMSSTNQPEARPFSPFAPSDAYSASTHGGSCYFTQTNNSEIYVSDATDFDFGTGDYTIEMWAYPIKTSFNNSWSMAINTTGVNQYWAWTDGAGNANAAGLSTSVSGGYSVDFADIPEPFNWSHIVFQNTSGVANWYLNGARVYETTHNENFSASATGLHIGNSPHYTGQFQYGGYLADIRVVKGSNAYTNGSTITVPTAPLTKITNTKLLLNFTQTPIIDQTGKTNLRSPAASIDTSIKKFGTGSVEFDGTADFIDISDRSVVPPSGIENWTVECFVYVNSHKNYNNIYCAGPYIQFYVNSSGKLATWIANASLSFVVNNFQSTNAISEDTWTHVALVRNGSTYTYYINGTANGTSSDSTAIPLLSTTNVSYLHLIGAYYNGSYSMDGYIDEFRITKKARYTSNFTAPTEAFLDK
tara:strand:+ start:1645 stop:3711 length:2067 start_codon:yes stop_codon:yes gene_type:complete